jgi:predicted NAD/FAD-dependent oxidoreductase
MLDAAIIGAGPYGLSADAHLRNIAGLNVRVFGKPMLQCQRLPQRASPFVFCISPSYN